MDLFNKIRKGLVSGFNSASDLTSEYTKIGRIKIEILGIKKEIEEKMLELGGRIYHDFNLNKEIDIKENEKVRLLVEQIRILDENLKEQEEALDRIKKYE